MQLSHLQTKLKKPAITASVVPRLSLLQQLCAGVDRKVTLISAPAGFGKSTLVSSWLDHLEAAPLHRKSAWLGLDEADNLLPRFVTYVVEAIEERWPGCCSAARELLRQRPDPTVEALADVLISGLNRRPESFVLVLDDLHMISNSAVYVFLTRLIEYAPSHFHLVMISRVDPPMPLSRWRARGSLNELRLRDLSFTVAETAAFLSRNLDRTPPTAAFVNSLHQRTEGWAVGIWMAVLALRNQTDYAEFESQLRASKDRYVADYLVEEVLDHQPAPLSRFLITTAILKRFSAGLCAALMEIDSLSAQQLIDQLARANLFVVELSSPPFWYRYHHQFQDMLLSRLHMRFDQAAIAALHRRAAAWLAANSDIDDALSHLMAIPDPDAAAELVARRRIEPLNQLQFVDLDAWLRKLPLSLVYQRADLLIGMAWIKHDQVDKEACLAFARQAEGLLEAAAALAADHHLLRAEINALRIVHDNGLAPETALTLIRQSWTLIRDQLAHTHCSVVLALAYGSQELGEMALAKTIVQTTLEEAPQWPLTARCRIAHAAGFFHFCSGEIIEAERRFQQNLLLAQEQNLSIVEVISRHGLGALADVRNQGGAAEEHHLNVLKHPFLTSGRDAVIAMYSLIGLYARWGDHEKIRSLVGRMKEAARLMGKSYFIEQTVAMEAYANLAFGQLQPAVLWALSTPHSEMETTSDRIPLIRARILLADGSEACLLEAEQILEKQIEFYASSYVWYRQTEVFVLQALVQERLNKTDSALELLAQAVELAVPKGGIGLFMGYGEAIGHMLRRLGTQPSLCRHVALLLAAFGADNLEQEKHVPAQKLPEPLTERELDVLALLAERLSNIEIARRMYVSPHTVRNHLANIFGKLEVQNRSQAVARARKLDLLDNGLYRR